MSPQFTLPLSVAPDDIDELNHVNNTVYLRWVQEVATAHWRARAPAEMQARYVWVVRRHEIDYLRPIALGQAVEARTRVAAAARGALWDRFVDIAAPADGADGLVTGQVFARAKTAWALIDRQTLRPARPPAAILAAFADG